MSRDARAPIDREALVTRHNIRITAPHPEHVLSVGNGDFAFTADITGLQTFTDFHDQSTAIRQGRKVVNTATMSSWGWHAMPNPEGFVLDDAMSEHQTRRGAVLYPDRHDLEGAMRGQVADENRAGAWLNANPQRLDLGRIGLDFLDEHGGSVAVAPDDLTDTEQELDLWSGVIRSRFRYVGVEVDVETVADPDASTVAFRIRSALLAEGRLRIVLRFPYAHAGFFQTSDWGAEERHSSTLTPAGGASHIDRALDETRYWVHLLHPDGSVLAGNAPQTFMITAESAQLDLVASFTPSEATEEPTSFDQVAAASARSWKQFWMSGAAMDLSGSDDPRAKELERRVVLSQYLTAVNSAGRMPPAETGLTTNSWSGKAHLEMHFWHAAHFATWGRPELLERSLPWYLAILERARSTAAGQGYSGARWPKQVGPDGRESPDPIGSFLIWQQPHVLYLLDLVWRASAPAARSALVLEYAELVDETAEFMASFVEERDDAFHLLSPVMPAQEFYDVTTTEDPTYELASWWWGLEIAQRWRERRGLDRHPAWADVQNRMATPFVQDGHYTAIATEPYLRRDDHPALLAALGVVPPTPVIDPEIMRATLHDVLENWEWPSAWGWDFPVLAMTAARLGEPDTAVDALLRDEIKNQFTLVGHNSQMGSILPIYLPGNGSLLAAVSLLATTGFPDSWAAQTEGFIAWP
ncbi:hypothetical protein [Microbacterium rhizomatis]|uniref:Glycoside hydrolase family 65 n=1 Tax=Microbacterium rhizomatis TaxID=1631477 RepID=A0A5J5IYM9_9MICO|nr:hypothetical protein [Microbacterium rhizomatis]KAA9106545.1 hypothetical protein F6B43_15560 [Microbacterium rhizomatis]